MWRLMVQFISRTRSHLTGYGKLSKKNIDDLQAGHREIKVTGEEGKAGPDWISYLWKPKKEGEPVLGVHRGARGVRAGILSALSCRKKYLGDQIDIHAGGEDLDFPAPRK